MTPGMEALGNSSEGGSGPSQSNQKGEISMRKSIFFAIALLVVGVTATLAQDVRYDYDKDKDFSRYKSYKWVSIKGADQPDELTGKRIMAAVDAELATKGLTKTDCGAGSILLA